MITAETGCGPCPVEISGRKISTFALFSFSVSLLPEPVDLGVSEFEGVSGVAEGAFEQAAAFIKAGQLVVGACQLCFCMIEFAAHYVEGWMSDRGCGGGRGRIQPGGGR